MSTVDVVVAGRATTARLGRLSRQAGFEVLVLETRPVVGGNHRDR